MATYIKTFVPTIYTYIKEGIYRKGEFRSGISKRGYSTTALNSNMADKGYAYFYTDEISAFLTGKNITKISVIIVSRKASGETTGTVPVTLYRTDIKYDADKAGFNTLGDTNPANGMTATNITNAHYIQPFAAQSAYGTSTTTELCTDATAQTLLESLAEGNALAAFNIKNSTQLGSEEVFNYRNMTISLVVEAENNESISAPTSVNVLTTSVKQGQSVNISVQGAHDGVNNPITGYLLQKRWKIADGSWSAWSASESFSGASELAVLTTTVIYPGATWQFRAAATSAGNTTEYVESSNTVTVYTVIRPMISVYDTGVTDYSKLGSAVLMPTKCEVSQTAGGDYSLTMEHQIDDGGKWKHIEIGNVIKVKVPATPITQISVAEKTKIYKTTCACNVYKDASAPRYVSYGQWTLYGATQACLKQPSTAPTKAGEHKWVYAPTNVGTYKCTVNGVNYQLTTNIIQRINWASTDGTSWNSYDVVYKSGASGDPKSSSAYYKSIPDSQGGSSLLATLANGTSIYMLEDYNSGWLKVMTLTGVEGYIQKANVVFVREATVDDINDQAINDQLFRIYKTVIDDAKRIVTVNALHVSYDHAGNLLKECNIKKASPATAIAALTMASSIELTNSIATNLTADDGTFTKDMSWMTLSNAILHKDKGIVANYDAKLVRNNWDYYIYKKESVNRGFVLRYGVNITGVTWTKDSSKLVTRVIPVAKDSQGSDMFIDDVYVDSSLIGSYPVVYVEKLTVDGKVGDDDGTGAKWTADTLKAEMLKKAQNRFDVDHADQPAVTLKVDFVMLGDTEEGKQYKGLQKLYLYDLVSVVDQTLGLEYEVQVQKTVWDAINQRYTGITLGTGYDPTRHLIGSANLQNGCVDFDKISSSAVKRLISMV